MGISVVKLLIGENQLYLTGNSLAESNRSSIRYLSEYHEPRVLTNNRRLFRLVGYFTAFAASSGLGACRRFRLRTSDH